MTGKVLIVEDEEMLARYLMPLLEKRGYQVRWVSSGRQALDVYQQEKPVAVLLDLGLPGEVSGLAVLEDIKTHSPQIKTVVITGYSDDHVKDKIKALGADLFIKKPFIPHRLLSALEELLTNGQKE